MPFTLLTVGLLAAFTPLVLAIVMTAYRWRQKAYPGFGHWILANVSLGMGFLLIDQRGIIPDFLSIIVGNILVMLGLFLIYAGLQLFFNRSSYLYYNYAILILYTILQIYLTYAVPNGNYRIALSGVAGALLLTFSSISAFHPSPPSLNRTSRGAAILLAVTALITFSRGLYAFTRRDQLNLLSDGVLAWYTLLFTNSLTVLTYYLFFLTAARLEIDLRETQLSLTGTLQADHHKMTELALLEETAKHLAESLDELEILQRTVDAVGHQFGYAMAAISLLVDGDQLELAVIGGTEQIGYQPGFRQKIGEGVIGHSAANRLAYISNNIEDDPYYFTIGKRSGSAVGVPLLDQSRLLGVLYVESTTQNAFSQEDVQTLEALTSHAVTAIQKSRLYTRVETQLQAITALQSVSQTILSSLELQEIFQSVVRLLQETFKYDYISIYRVDDQVLRLGAHIGYPDNLVFREIPVHVGIAGRTIRTKQIQFVPNVSSDPAFLRAAPGIESEICVPLLKGEQPLGVLNVEAVRGHPLSDSDVKLLGALAGPIAIAIENARLHAEIKQLALTDALTNLANRRAFDQVLEGEIARAARYQHQVALVIIDMDSFKDFNDRWGHPAGDERLREVAALLRASHRSPDFVARYGGEEFALILPHTPKASAAVLAERVRAAAEACSSERSGPGAPIPGYTMSLGVAAYPEDGATLKDLLIAADRAELDAKRLGKNRVIIAGSAQDQAI